MLCEKLGELPSFASGGLLGFGSDARRHGTNIGDQKKCRSLKEGHHLNTFLAGKCIFGRKDMACDF